MKKYFLFACVAAALVSCSSDDFLGNEAGLNQQTENGAIVFQSYKSNNSRATVGKAAADLLGGNFIVEGFKGAETATAQASDLVFDNYLVVWEENTAGKTEDNTNDWRYVGVTGSSKMAAAQLTGLGRTISEQSIKYWDYSTENYAFAAYSAGTLNMISSGAPVAGTSVKVTKIANPLGASAYTFTAANAADLSKCYYTDVTPVAKANYNKPVTLTFKQLGAKVRLGMYETVPGYSVKNVEFYKDESGITPATYTAFSGTLPADQDALDTQKESKQLYVEDSTGVYKTYKAYNSEVTAAKLFTEATAEVLPTTYTDATFFLTGSTNKFPEAGAVTVSYNKLGYTNASNDGYNKATVDVNPEAGSTTTTKAFGALTANYTGAQKSEAAGNIYLGRELASATMAGASADGFFTPVIPVSTGAALTLRCNYTLVSTDGSGEEIKVWGAKAVVPANFCEWQPNYAYTYIFKISDNTNGSTEKLGGTEELFPITFDAVVADITDASAEQTTVTTVATPSVTTYQYGHKKGEEYKAGDIYVEVVKDGELEALTGKTYLYTTDNDKATEADVIDALQMNVGTGTDVVGRNGLTLVPEATAIDLAAHEIPAVDGTTISVAAGKSGKFTADASKNYVFVYDYTTSATPSDIYSYDDTVSTTDPGTDWATVYTSYFTKNADGTYSPAPATWVAGVYYKKYINNGCTYAVKVIKTGTAY